MNLAWISKQFKSGKKTLFLLAVNSVFLSSGFTSDSSYAEGIDWQIAPYLWSFDTSLDLTLNNEPSLGGELSFKDAMDKLDSAFMGHVEGRSENFGMFGDSLVVNLSDSTIRTIGPGGPVLGDLQVDTNLKLKLYELGGFYRIAEPTNIDATFDLMLGARLVDVEQIFGLTLPGPEAGFIQKSVNISETDVFIGGRVIGQLSERWHYKARVDMGGGGTEGSLNLMASVGYTFGKTGLFAVDFGYKHLVIDLSSNNGETYVDTKIEMSGPLVGFVFNF